MVMTNKKYKYVYDLKSKKLVKKVLNEDENAGVTTDTQQQNQNQNQQQTQQPVQQVSLADNKDLQNIQAELQTRDKKYQDDLQAQQKLLQVATTNATKKGYTGPYDPAQVDSDVLNIQQKIIEINKQYAIDKANIETKRINVLKSLATTNEKWYNLPAKYKGLNESNIADVKVYMKSLIGENKIIRDMNGFKRVFENTTLLYGKDRHDYFVVAIDGEDVNMINETLQRAGYTQDEIYYTLMPQLLDA